MQFYKSFLEIGIWRRLPTLLFRMAGNQGSIFQDNKGRFQLQIYYLIKRRKHFGYHQLQLENCLPKLLRFLYTDVLQSVLKFQLLL